MDLINSVIDFLNGIIWSNALVYFCLITGLYFSIRTKFLQVRLIKPMVKYLFEGKDSKEGISSFQALCTALAGLGRDPALTVALILAASGVVAPRCGKQTTFFCPTSLTFGKSVT